MHSLSFDNSLSALVEAVDETFGRDAIESGRALRDAKGQLTFFSSARAPSEEERGAAQAVFLNKLGPYARADRVLAYGDDPGAHRILTEADSLVITLADGRNLRLLDRRIVAAGWLDKPREEPARPTRVVFASLKGGVGRSTALTITAAEFAAKGSNVLVIDLDIEAPGIGSLLLTDDRKPDFGTLDFLVENGIGKIGDDDLNKFVGISPLTNGQGRVDVVPAFGRLSLTHPENTLPKLSRALTDDITDGQVQSLTSQISTMIERFVGREAYDLVLIDSRAGLAEISAPAVLGLGGLVLLFGTAQRQTIEGYRALFAGLKMLAERDREAGSSALWRTMFKPVLAKATFSKDAAPRYQADIYDLFAENLYDPISEEVATFERINFLADDSDAPHSLLAVRLDTAFADFEPVSSRDQLSQAFYEAAFRPFLDGLGRAIQGFAVDASQNLVTP